MLLTPILHGAFHTESSAEFLVRFVVATKDEKLVKALVATLASHTGVDLRVLYGRPPRSRCGRRRGIFKSSEMQLSIRGHLLLMRMLRRPWLWRRHY